MDGRTALRHLESHLGRAAQTAYSLSYEGGGLKTDHDGKYIICIQVIAVQRRCKKRVFTGFRMESRVQSIAEKTYVRWKVYSSGRCVKLSSYKICPSCKGEGNSLGIGPYPIIKCPACGGDGFVPV